MFLIVLVVHLHMMNWEKCLKMMDSRQNQIPEKISPENFLHPEISNIILFEKTGFCYLGHENWNESWPSIDLGDQLNSGTILYILCTYTWCVQLSPRIELIEGPIECIGIYNIVEWPSVSGIMDSVPFRAIWPYSKMFYYIST